jgi:protein tyrosine/serine phosphatase
MSEKATHNISKRPWIRLSAILGAIVLLAAGAYGYWAHVEHRFLTITEGKVYRSGAMPPEKLQRVVQKHGIRTVIDLRENDKKVAAESQAMAAIGVHHINIHSPQVPNADVVRRFIDTMRRDETYPVLIHCNHGIGRAVLFSAIYRMEFEGWDRERARKTAYWRSAMGSFTPEDEKGAFILKYTPIRSAGKSMKTESS